MPETKKLKQAQRLAKLDKIKGKGKGKKGKKKKKKEESLFRILGRDFLNEMNELKKYKK